MLVILYLPILILAVYSFTDSANIGTIHGFSVQNYVTLFTKPELADMIWGTVLLAVGSALIATFAAKLSAASKSMMQKLNTFLNRFIRFVICFNWCLMPFK